MDFVGVTAGNAARISGAAPFCLSVDRRFRRRTRMANNAAYRTVRDSTADFARVGAGNTARIGIICVIRFTADCAVVGKLGIEYSSSRGINARYAAHVYTVKTAVSADCNGAVLDSAAVFAGDSAEEPRNRKLGARFAMRRAVAEIGKTGVAFVNHVEIPNLCAVRNVPEQTQIIGCNQRIVGKGNSLALTVKCVLKAVVARCRLCADRHGQRLHVCELNIVLQREQYIVIIQTVVDGLSHRNNILHRP